MTPPADPSAAPARPFLSVVRGEPSQTRQEVAKALRLLRGKRASLPAKKHGNIPL